MYKDDNCVSGGFILALKLSVCCSFPKRLAQHHDSPSICLSWSVFKIQSKCVFLFIYFFVILFCFWVFQSYIFDQSALYVHDINKPCLSSLQPQLLLNVLMWPVSLQCLESVISLTTRHNLKLHVFSECSPLRQCKRLPVHQ